MPPVAPSLGLPPRPSPPTHHNGRTSSRRVYYLRLMRLTSALSLLLIAGCTRCSSNTPAAPVTPIAVDGDGNTLLEEQASLSPSGTSFETPVQSGDQITVSVQSDSFDPTLEVTPPGGALLRNDDWQGSRNESRVSFVASAAGDLKITVRSVGEGHGNFRLVVRRTTDGASGPPLLQIGSSHEGTLEAGDEVLPSGQWSDRLLVAGQEGQNVQLQLQATGQATPLAILVDPQGRVQSATNNGNYALNQNGTYRVQLISAAPGQSSGYRLSVVASAQAQAPAPQLNRTHHQLPTTSATQTLALGETHTGSLEMHDARLPTGESADLYAFEGQAQQPFHVELSSSDFDAYLMLIGPNGQHWENDDAGGGLNSALDLTLPTTGTYRIVASAYRAGMRGTYELKLNPQNRTPTPTAAPPQAPPAQGREITGELAAGDGTLNSGEFRDVHTLDVVQGQRVRLEAISTAFDTYLMVRSPGGHQQDNDDATPGNTNAALDFVANETGQYQVFVTSYQPGETGAYQLRINGAAGSNTGAPTPTTPPPAPTNPTPATPSAPNTVTGDTTGTLVAGDATLNSGEFVDRYQRSFDAGSSIEIRLDSSEFDPYLIVTTPSGRQLDNDDLDSSTRNAGINLPAAEEGQYQISVTSYQPGETGSYNLRFGAGAAIARPSSNTGSNGGNGAQQGGRIFGLFAGITDYPAGVGDLPECANDAIKLSEALREAGLLQESNQVLLTDAQATTANVRAGLQRLASQMGPDDIFVFFYSGHGGQTQNSQDAREIDGRDEYLVLHDGPLLDDEFGRLFDSVQAGTSVVALDACYSGGFAKDVITRPGRVGLFSSEEDVLSAVAGQFQAGGYLSHFLRTAVSGEADRSPRDQVLTVGELTHYLYTQFGRHATDVELQGAYQHLVVDRGAVRVDRVLWSYR